jgi:glycosyltransferase involved in cell wall biosynthesis
MRDEPKRRRISVVTPCFNEEGNVEPLINRIHEIFAPSGLTFEAVIVDDCSTDGTKEIAERLQRENPAIVYLRHRKNQGKTEGLKTGFAATRGDIVIVQDADLEYDPTEIPLIIQPILDQRADVVYGSRFLVRRATRVLYYYHYVGNRLLTTLSNIFTNLNMTDIETGYKAFRGDIIRNMVIKSRGFGFEVEVTAKVAKLGCTVYEVPISYYGRTYEEGKKIGFSDGVSALWLILRFNLFTSLRASFRQPIQLDIPAGKHNTAVIGAD